MAEGFFKSTHPGTQLATIIPLGLRRVEPAVKRREMSCSRAPRVFAGLRLSRFCFSAVWHFLSMASPLLPQCPSFTRSEIGKTGAAGQRSRRICDACRVTVRIAVGRELG